jgi:cyclophilin family peptidyl-prolyl cis-trans isomerase
MPEQPPPADPGARYEATLETSAGTIRLELFASDAPVTVGNFVGLARQGFYDGTVFHRVIPDFMVQGGCPQGRGTGDPGYRFQDEINPHKLVRGTLAMANAGPGTNGSQFFIVTREHTDWLDGHHTAFGRVLEGQDVVEAISRVPRDRSDRPREEQRLIRVSIEESAGAIA